MTWYCHPTPEAAMDRAPGSHRNVSLGNLKGKWRLKLKELWWHVIPTDADDADDDDDDDTSVPLSGINVWARSLPFAP